VPSDFVSIDSAGDLFVLILKVAGSIDDAIGQDKLTFLVDFAPVKVCMNGPRACKTCAAKADDASEEQSLREASSF